MRASNFFYLFLFLKIKVEIGGEKQNEANGGVEFAKRGF